MVVEDVTDAKRWNDWITRFPEYDFKQGYEWGELRRSLGWTPHRLAVLDGGECRAATLVQVARARGLGAVMYAPRGPLFRRDDLPALDRLVDAVRGLGRRTGAIVLRASPRAPRDRLVAPLLERRFRVLPDRSTIWNSPRYTQTLDLSPPEDAIWRGVRRRVREYVGAARRKGLVIEASSDVADLGPFHTLLGNVARRKKFPLRPLAYFEDMMRLYQPGGHLLFLVARWQGRMVGGILGTILGRRTLMMYTSVRSDEAPTLAHHVSPALYWEYLRRAKAAGCDLADFGPSGVELDPRDTDNGWGVYKFKEAFGFRFEVFGPYYDLVLRPALYPALRAAETRVGPWLWRLGTLRSRVLESRPGRRVARALRRPPAPAAA
jgi:peptidoglycan pentaglycine glycine transferase (the first glycine)